MVFKALEIYEEIGNKWGIAHTLSTIGIIYGNQHLYDKALEYFFRSLEISKEIGEKISATLGHIGHIFNRIGDYHRALECQQKVLIKQEEIDFKPGVSSSLQKISTNYEDMGEYDKALDYANRAFKIAEKLGDNSRIILCLDSIGIIYYKMGNYKKTAEYLEKSLSIYDKTKEGINFLLLNKTYLYLAYKKLGKAYDKKKLQILIKEKGKIPFDLNFCIFQLLEDTSYLETAYNQVQEKADNLEPDVAAKFLSYPIPKAIVEKWEKVK
jgi:tetratricopeptide (TPR) repeat protein